MMTRVMCSEELVALAALIALAGCGPRHIKEYEPRQRDYESPVTIAQDEERRQSGSLWTKRDTVNYLYADQRALQVGDILTVKVEEFADAQREAGTSKKRLSEMNAEIEAFLGMMTRIQQIYPSVEPEALVGGGTGLGFDVRGETGRSERLQATVPAMVKKRLPNGNLFLEGHRVILVNEEEHHFYISGVARPIDIDETNSVPSSRLADAEIEFTGRGVLSEAQRPGPVARFLQWIWPF